VPKAKKKTIFNNLSRNLLIMSYMKFIYFCVVLTTIIDVGTTLDLNPLNPWTLPVLPISPDKIKIYGYNQAGVTFNQTLTGSEMKAHCPPGSNVTLIIHGWTESITRYWVDDMVKGFRKNRGGCVLFMDYSYYANETFTSYQTVSYLGYPILFAYFHPLSEFVKEVLCHVEELGYSPDNILMFTFSFGGHIGFQGAYLYSVKQGKQINAIHACDPAGPIFDQLITVATVVPPNLLNNLLPKMLSPSEFNARFSAKYVQCIHTNGILLDGTKIGEGTTRRFCKTDIDMGNCGETQAAATDTISSHLLCPLFYMSAFDNDFKLINKPPNCKNQTYAPVVKNKNLVMGLRFDTSAEDGEYYSNTYQPPLYNAP